MSKPHSVHIHGNRAIVGSSKYDSVNRTIAAREGNYSYTSTFDTSLEKEQGVDT